MQNRHSKELTSKFVQAKELSALIEKTRLSAGPRCFFYSSIAVGV